MPVRVKPSPTWRQAASEGAPEVADGVPPVTDREAVTWGERPSGRTRVEPQPDVKARGVHPGARELREGSQGPVEKGGGSEMWRDRALRLQAEMENYRKRQQRLAEEQTTADCERLLRAFLNVADDLERALSADSTDGESLRQGVDLTYQGLMRLMDQEGAEPVQAEGQPFDPVWHEAVGTMDYEQADTEPDMVIQVVQTGYRLGDRLLRPARVIVAT